MKFYDYLLGLCGMHCNVWLFELSAMQNEGGGMFILSGILEVGEDFLLIYPTDGGTPTAFIIEALLMIEVVDAEEIEDEEEEDPYVKFEKYYREYRERKG